MPSLDPAVMNRLAHLAHSIGQLGTGGTDHSLCDPIECGGHFWIFCKCGWLLSADRELDLPGRCKFESLAMEFEREVLRAERIARMERKELRRLLTRCAAGA
jgi:hypothetical protein